MGPIQAKFNEDDFFVMNIDEFLAENNLQLEAQAESRAKVETSPEPEELSCVSPNMMSSVSPPRGREPCFKALHHRLKRYDATKCSSPHPRLPLQGVEARQVGEGKGGEAQETGG